MTIEYSAKTNLFFAQAYGANSYGAEEYSNCQQTSNGCVPITSTGAPSTGFFGLSPDAAVASGAGALLVAVAIVGSIYVVLKRRSHKTKTQE